MKRKLIAFCMAMFVFAGSSMTAMAAVCPHPNAQVCAASNGQVCPAPGAPEGVHHFDDCKYVGMGRTEDRGTHLYLYGYDSNKNPIYHNCKMTQTYLYCINVCHWCGQEDTNSAHEHAQEIKHSVSHP